MLAVRVSAHTGYWTTVIPLECVFGLGIAAMVAPLMSTALSSVPTDHAGVASGVNNAVFRAAALLWIAALPPITGLSGPAYANAAALRGGYQEICVVCAASLALGERLPRSLSSIAGGTRSPTSCRRGSRTRPRRHDCPAPAAAVDEAAGGAGGY
jgi:hypothetical protein